MIEQGLTPEEQVVSNYVDAKEKVASIIFDYDNGKDNDGDAFTSDAFARPSEEDCHVLAEKILAGLGITGALPLCIVTVDGGTADIVTGGQNIEIVLVDFDNLKNGYYDEAVDTLKYLKVIRPLYEHDELSAVALDNLIEDVDACIPVEE